MEVHPWSWLYFATFMVLGSYMILNLLIAIMLSQFKIVMHQDEQP